MTPEQLALLRVADKALCDRYDNDELARKIGEVVLVTSGAMTVRNLLGRSGCTLIADAVRGVYR